ncbi:HAMP domain-containing protein [Thermoleophilia bacterium SCSIO 60948]|nr:HAMP domain-containing protein [Thermoleophilia bacterium SCSIO 60948]
MTDRPDSRRGARAVSDAALFWRVFLPNALVLAVAVFALAFSPLSVSASFSWQQAIALLGALAALVAVNLLLIRRAVAPLERLTAAMASVDPLVGGSRVPVEGGGEAAELARVFNQMAERLEHERRESGERLLSAQEAERVRLARELHDEIGQSLTGLMLELDVAARKAPPEVADELASTRETARRLTDEVREVVRGLRPDVLSDLGLARALRSLAHRFSTDPDLTVVGGIESEPPDLSPAVELAVYRVAQEAMTNAVRHAGATRVLLRLRTTAAGALVLQVSDDGGGLAGSEPGGGQRGMLERAVLAGGRLRLGPSELGGTEVRLEVPARTQETER